MNKKERNKKVRQLLESTNANVTVLDTGRILEDGNFEWRHIRVDGFGDVWPSTGTFKQGSKWHKRNFERLISALENHFNLSEVDGYFKSQAETKDLILTELLKRVEDLEVKVYQLENGKI